MIIKSRIKLYCYNKSLKEAVCSIVFVEQTLE